MPIFNQTVKGGGTTPTGTKNITANGVYDVTDFASADVQVPTTAPAHYVEKTVDANGKLQNTANFINLNGVNDIGGQTLSYAYAGTSFPNNTNIDMSSITQLTGTSACAYMFLQSSGSINVDMSNVQTITGNSACNSMFQYSGISSIDLSSLVTLGSYCMVSAFENSSLQHINFPSLTTTGSGTLYAAFRQCSNLISIKLNALNNITGQLSNDSYGAVAGYCSKLETVELGGLTASTFASAVNQLQYLFDSSTGQNAPNGCTVHLPSNFDPSDPNHTFDASTLTGYPTFGGSASYIHVAFDLPATE